MELLTAITFEPKPIFSKFLHSRIAFSPYYKNIKKTGVGSQLFFGPPPIAPWFLQNMSKLWPALTSANLHRMTSCDPAFDSARRALQDELTFIPNFHFAGNLIPDFRRNYSIPTEIAANVIVQYFHNHNSPDQWTVWLFTDVRSNNCENIFPLHFVVFYHVFLMWNTYVYIKLQTYAFVYHTISSQE